MPLAGPAAARIGPDIWAGWIEASGEVKVAKVVPTTARPPQMTTLHRFDVADDHSAPSLLAAGSKLLVATSAHSGDLFVYAGGEGGFRQSCHLSGRYSYPRLFRDGGRVRMLVRSEERETDGPENYRGDLSVIDIGDGGNCSTPTQLIRPGFRQWIYAPYPHVSEQGVFVAWTIYDDVTRKHEGAYLGRLSLGGIADAVTLANPEAGIERLVWSVDSEGVKVSAFDGQFVDGFFTCCRKGQAMVELYALDGKLKSKTEKAVTEYYPVPVKTSCGVKGAVIAAMRSEGIEIALTTEKSYNQRDFRGATLTLCAN